MVLFLRLDRILFPIALSAISCRAFFLRGHHHPLQPPVNAPRLEVTSIGDLWGLLCLC